MNTESAKEECEKLMSSLLPFAKKMLSEYREFYPYGGFMRPLGEIVHVGGKIEGTDHPKSADLINLLREKAVEVARKNESKAVAIIFDVRIKVPGTTEKTDAIQVCLDHREDYSTEVLFPYSIEDDGQVTYGAPFAQLG
jgi:hypothetical protein